MDRQQILQQIQAQSRTAFSQARSQALQEAVRNLPANAAATGDSSGGGGNGLPSNCIQFVVDTTEGTFFTFSFNTTGPINFTVDWGDGTTHEDSGAGGFYSEEHTYPDSDTQYTVRLCFDDITTVLEFTSSPD